MDCLKRILIFCTGIFLVLPANAQQNYPNKPVRLVLAFTPGSSIDIVGRAVAAKLQEHWGQPVVPANLPAEVAAMINRDVNAVLTRADLREQLTRLGTEPGSYPLPEFAAFVRKEVEDTQKVLVAAGIKPQ